MRHILGSDIDAGLLSDILRIGAEAEELVRAKAWVEDDEAQIDAHAPFPAGRVAQLVEILEPDRDDEEPG